MTMTRPTPSRARTTGPTRSADSSSTTRRGGRGLLVAAIPYLWLLAFFLAPFLIVLRIALSDAATDQPPYAPHFLGFDTLGEFLAAASVTEAGTAASLAAQCAGEAM